MKKIAFFFLIVGLISCNHKKNIPDVSGIAMNLKVERFEKDFFAMDTNHLSVALDTMQSKYPDFLKNYLYNILVLEPKPDTVLKYVKSFIKDYHFVYDTAQLKIQSVDEIKKQLEQACRFVKYYFPEYKLPDRITTFVGPIEGTANGLTQNSFAVGLQSYLGKNFSVYQSEYVSNVYPAYKSRRFELPYIVVNSMRNIMDDMYPLKTTGKPLMEQMIEAGKRLYMLDALLPETADTLKTGYTQQQLDFCFANEKKIWTFFIENNLLYETEPNLIGSYVNDGPSTPEFGEISPGNIGEFTGWQIVKKWMNKNEKKSLSELMQTPAKQIFDEAKYKP